MIASAATTRPLASLFKGPTAAPNPADVSRQLGRRNRVIKEEFADRILRLTSTPSTVRILPALPESKLTGPTNYMLRVEAYDFDHCGEILRPGADTEKNGTVALDRRRQDDPICKFRRYIFNDTDLGFRKGSTEDDRKFRLFPRVKGIVWLKHSQKEVNPNLPLPAIYLLYGLHAHPWDVARPVGSGPGQPRLQQADFWESR